MASGIYMSVILIGLAAGILSGLLGVGGGTIIVPALVLILGISQHLAQGISLAVFIPTSALGAYAYYRRKYIHLNTASSLALGTSFGVIIGVIMANYIPACELRKLFGVFMIIIALTMLRSK